MIVGVAVIRAAAIVLRRFAGSVTLRRTQRRWFHELTDHYLAQPLRFYADEPTGKLLAHTDTDAERAGFAIMPVPLTIGAVAMLIFASISLAVLDPILFVIGLALFPTLIVLNQLFSTRVERPSARAQAGVAAVSSIAHESFEGALIVKVLGLDRHERDRLAGAADDLRRERIVIGRLRAVFEPALETLPALATVALLGVGASRVDAGAITTGDLVQAMTLFGILSFPMRVMGFFLEELPRSVVSRDRVIDVLSSDWVATDAVARPDAHTPLPDGPLSVRVDGVSFAFGDEPVLSDVNVDVAAGSVVAIVGSTGAGKSTLCSTIAGLIRPTAGRVLVGDVDLAHVPPHTLTDAVAMVFQETFLFADSVRENLVLGADVDDDALDEALAIAHGEFVHDLADGIDTMVGERGVSLSGGQRQRLALARALLRSPRVLLLDDATSAIDPLIEQGILDALRHRLATTTLVVAHRIATIRLADRVVQIEDGRVVGVGTHDELLATSPAYEALVRAYEDDAT